MALKLAEGESFIDGRSPKKARELLEKAEKAGLDKSTVRTTSGGYIVPSKLVNGEDASASGDEQADEPSGSPEAGAASDEAAALKADGASAEDQKEADGEGQTESTTEDTDTSQQTETDVSGDQSTAEASISGDQQTAETGGDTEKSEPSKRKGKTRNSGQSDSEGDK